MRKINRLSLVVDASKKGGYDMTAYLYCQGDRSPSSSQEYRALTIAELHEVLESVTSRWRPGWEYAPDLEQPPLWDLPNREPVSWY